VHDGKRVLIRPIHPQDEGIVQDFVRSLSPRSRYLRFNSGLNETTPQMLKYATHIDYKRHMALIAKTFDDNAETAIGVASYVVGGRARARSLRSRSPIVGSAGG
jgi:acetyltransferase